MRYLIIMVMTLLYGTVAKAQTADDDSSAPYRKIAYMPDFTMRQPDSSAFSKANIEKHRPTLILYFSPDCGHCQIETENLLSKMKELGKLQIVMVTSRPFEDMKNFAEHYKLERFPAIKIGADADRAVTRFYDVHFTPFSALYGKDGKLVKVYKDGINYDELASLSR